MDDEVITEQLATAEIERYMGNPGQALSDKTGQLKILEWRARYEKQLGPKSDRRAFHDEFLAGGAMPLAVVERRLNAWAARQRQRIAVRNWPGRQRAANRRSAPPAPFPRSAQPAPTGWAGFSRGWL